MNIASVPTTFTLEGGAILVVASGTRWQTIIGHPHLQGGDAVSELAALRERASRLLSLINAMRALHGGEPIT